MTRTAPSLSPQEELERLVVRLSEGDDSGIDATLAAYPDDPRLQFLKGSVLAGERRYPEARAAMGRAVELAPDYAIARFQLGFLEFTSGEPGAAAATWAPLEKLPAGDALRLFAEGLMHLPRDEVADAIGLLERGVAANQENPALNRDIRLLIGELAPLRGPDDEATSETDRLLRQFGAGVQH